MGLAELPRDCVPHLDAAATLGIAREHLERLAKLDGGHAERIVDADAELSAPEHVLLAEALHGAFGNQAPAPIQA